MTVKTEAQTKGLDGRPRLVYLHTPTSGHCRRVEGYLAQVLQRNRNHTTFAVIRISVDDLPALAEHLSVTKTPTIMVIDEGEEKARIEAPIGCAQIEKALMPWLHH